MSRLDFNGMRMAVDIADRHAAGAKPEAARVREAFWL
jgi:hypothetical protein